MTGVIQNKHQIKIDSEPHFSGANEIRFKLTVDGTDRLVVDNRATPRTTVTGEVYVTGILNMGSNRIEAVANPDSDDDALNRGYADGRYVNVTGDTMTGILNMGSNRIEGVANPNSNDDAVNLGYADGRYVNTTGDTMSGILNMGNNRIEGLAEPNSNDDAVNLGYLNAQLGGIQAELDQTQTDLNQANSDQNAFITTYRSSTDILLNRTLGGAGSYVEIGDFFGAAGFGSNAPVRVAIAFWDGAASVSKIYEVSLTSTLTGGQWGEMQPISDSGPAVGNDFALDLKTQGTTLSMRLRRFAGGSSGVPVKIVLNYNEAICTFTPKTGTGTAAPPTLETPYLRPFALLNRIVTRYKCAAIDGGGYIHWTGNTLTWTHTMRAFPYLSGPLYNYNRYTNITGYGTPTDIGAVTTYGTVPAAQQRPEYGSQYITGQTGTYHMTGDVSKITTKSYYGQAKQIIPPNPNDITPNPVGFLVYVRPPDETRYQSGSFTDMYAPMQSVLLNAYQPAENDLVIGFARLTAGGPNPQGWFYSSLLNARMAPGDIIVSGPG
jgi:hypothetical protein